MREFLIPSEAVGLRLDHFLASQLSHLSRSRLQALIKEGHILVEGQPAKPGEKLRPGKSISVHEPEATPVTDTVAEAIPLEILFEDNDLLVLNKQPGMVVHPAAGNPCLSCARLRASGKKIGRDRSRDWEASDSSQENVGARIGKGQVGYDGLPRSERIA